MELYNKPEELCTLHELTRVRTPFVVTCILEGLLNTAVFKKNTSFHCFLYQKYIFFVYFYLISLKNRNKVRVCYSDEEFEVVVLLGKDISVGVFQKVSPLKIIKKIFGTKTRGT